MIDVIVPVYRSLEHTRRCIESVLGSAQRAAFELVVVDDASPEPEVSRYVAALAAAGRATLLTNERNLGFVHSVNRGMALHPERDVVLLNSDTEVANDWVDRLVAAAASAPRIATVTPFSNNATICSYPFEGCEAGVPGTLGLAELDRCFATANAARVLDIPTAVGFCMFIARAALDELGLFDAERYGRGYGEENDFCMKALKADWRNLLAADVFVFHEGSVSFSQEKDALIQVATETLVAAHPEYPRLVQDFMAADPAAPLRAAVDLERAARGRAEAECVLAERIRERNLESARAAERLRIFQEYAGRKEAEVAALNKALAEATALIAEIGGALDKAGGQYGEALTGMERRMAGLEEEIGKLRAGLAYAESLAFSRLDELDRIKSSWFWRRFGWLVETRQGDGADTQRSAD